MSEFSLLSFCTAALARNSATPPPATMPSSTAALVACMASSTRSFFSLHLNFSRATNPDHRHPTGELGQALLQLLAIVVRRGLLDLRLDLLNAPFDVLLGARPVDDGRVFFFHAHPLGATEHVEGHVLQLDAEVFRHGRAAGQDRDV